MMSPERAAATAANAVLSTGPKTYEGKARVSQNARKHGLTARDLIVPDDQRDEFNQLLAEHTEEVQPAGAIEQTIFDQLVRAAWDLRRIGRMQAEQCQNGVDPLLDETKRAEADRLARYHGRAERSYYRALRELRALQTNRALRDTLDQEYEECVPEMADISKVTKQSHPKIEMEENIMRRAYETNKMLSKLIASYSPGQNKPTAPAGVTK